MNIQEYISSGIVESYVLGLATPEEMAEFERVCAQYPEAAKLRNDFEIALESRMFSLALNPAAGVKEKLMSGFRQQSNVNQTPIITMEKSTSPFKWVAAASIILLLVAGYFAYSYHSKNKELQTKLTKSQKAEEDALKKMEMVSDPNVAVVTLKGTDKAPKSAVNVYWDSTSSNVYLVVKNMPKLPSEQQYQLWSLIKGQTGLEPTSLGLFDIGENGKILLKMETGVKKADAFAITIEKRGNTGGPTLEQLQASNL